MKRLLFSSYLFFLLTASIQAQVAFVPDGGPGIRLAWTTSPLLDGILLSPHFMVAPGCNEYHRSLRTCLPPILQTSAQKTTELLLGDAAVPVYGKMVVIDPFSHPTYLPDFPAETTDDTSDYTPSGNDSFKGKGPGALLGLGMELILAVTLDHNWGGGNTETPEPK